MTEPESFVAAIAADPAADAPRLVYADWLEEHGDATRAGFIRDQVQLAKLRPGTDEYRQLFRRTADTLRANLPAWIQSVCEAFGQPAKWNATKSLGPGLGLSLADWTTEEYENGQAGRYGLTSLNFARGFIGWIGLRYPRLESPDALNCILRDHPITGFFSEFPSSVQTWKRVATASLRQVKYLELFGGAWDEVADAMFADTCWTGVTKLSLPRTSAATVQRLCASPLAKRLTGLRMPCDQAYFVELSHFPVDDRLCEFVMRSAPSVADWPPARPMDGCDRLSAVTFRPTLKRLDLAGCRMGDRGLAAFARGDVWIRLRALVLDRNRFGDPGWRDFVRGRRTPELRLLSASRNFVGNDGAVRLGQSPLADTLEYIDLRGNRIEGKGAVALARSLAGGPLKKLLLAGNPIPPKDAAAVCRILSGRVDVGG